MTAGLRISPIRKYSYAVSIIVVLVLQMSCGSFAQSPAVYKFDRTQMGTRIEITVVCLSEIDAKNATGRAFAEIDRIESLLSEYRGNSDISRINGRAGGDWVEISQETYKLLLLAVDMANRSSGAFDITFKSLEVWDFHNPDAEPPSAEQIQRRMELVDYRNLEFNLPDRSVRLKKKGTAIGLGGIAKGYAVSRAVMVLRDYGIESGIVNAGGDLYAFGDKLGQPWIVGIQDPRNTNELAATIEVRDTAVVTSGDYERYFLHEGTRYHHILDPRTGYPAAGCRSVTILAEDPTIADAMSTAVFVLGPEKGMALVEESLGVECMIIDSQGSVMFSFGASSLGLKAVQ